MEYLHWDEKKVVDFSDQNISDMYDRGYVFTRIGKGIMHQTRSVRIDLSKFEISSENRRILKKIGFNDDIGSSEVKLDKADVPVMDYDWSLGKLAKDFYEKKFGAGIMSAQKIKEMLTDPLKSNFNCLLKYTDKTGKFISGTISYMNKYMLHYSYPFYALDTTTRDMGLGMMIMAINYAKKNGTKYIYLGSLQRPTDTYKLQFAGLEWFDGGKEGSQEWSSATKEIKEILNNLK